MTPAAARLTAAAAVLVCAAGCLPNDPYRAEDSGKKTYYSTFTEPPKTFDPSVAYTYDAYVLLGLVYEPPLGYHYLKRPYELVPLTAAGIPRPVTRAGFTTLDVRIRPGIRYQPHPCFGHDAGGRPLPLPPSRALEGLYDLAELPGQDTRELVAADYVTAIQRLADPTLSAPCPILPTMAKYIVGLDRYAAALARDLEAERSRRRKAGGAFYSPEVDERDRPILLDYGRHPLPGARVLDRYTFRITIRGRYPQILYWLAMPFFSPIPPEALRWYGQGPYRRHNITLDRFPVGTGPYRFKVFNPNREIVMVRNENYHGMRYPSTGAPGDREAGLLQDAGQPLPFIDRIVLKLEREVIPRWIKFQQGWYDASGVPSESFDQVVGFSDTGELALSPEAQRRHYRLETESELGIRYFAFNMLDDVVGGYSESRRKLRHALSIAINIEEEIQIFLNGLGVPAQSMLPPGLFGYDAGPAGVNPWVYSWDAKTKTRRRRSLAEAKRLLAEAGWPGGRNREGRQLEIRFANAWNSAEQVAMIRWLTQKFDSLGVRLVSETTDYNRFQEKVRQGNFQMLSWGWIADYPDPENFLFLLYGRNGQKLHAGENHSNYDNPEFNRVFESLETMENSPERMALIRKALAISQRDAPLAWGYHPMSLGLYHAWLRNTKPHSVMNGQLAYYRLDPALRAKARSDWNRPVVWPVAAGLLVLAALSVPAFVAVRRRLERVG